MRPISIQVDTNNGQNAPNPLMKRDYQYNSAGNITSRNTEKGKVDYRYDQLDRLIEAIPDASLQAIGLPNEGYTYDAIGNRLGSRHQPGSWQYNGQDQLMSWGTGSQAEVLSYTATGQLKQNKRALETLDYDYDATDRLTEVKRNNITLANYQYDPFGRRMSKEVNGERTYYLYSDEGLIAELNDRGNTEVAYGWMPDSAWGTNPLWQANLTTGQTLKNAAYHYLHTDHLGTPQIATNQEGNIIWQAEAEAFGETHLNESNQITMNLRFPGQYYDAETDTHYNYFRDYNPRTGRYQQSDPIGLKGGINHYGYVEGNPLLIIDPEGLRTVFLYRPPINQRILPGQRSVQRPVYNQNINYRRSYNNSHDLQQSMLNGQASAMIRNIREIDPDFRYHTANNGSRGFSGRDIAQLRREYDRVTCGQPFSLAPSNNNEVAGLPRVRSGNKPDKYHAFPNTVDAFASNIARFSIPRRARGGKVVGRDTLYQVQGGFGTREGIFEWVVSQGKVTHRLFIPNGTITGYANQRPQK